MPPTLSLWPLRNFVVLCSDDVGAERQRPLDVRAGEGVVDDDADVRAGARSRWRAARSVICSIGLVGVSMNRYFVFGVIAGSISSSCEVST